MIIINITSGTIFPLGRRCSVIGRDPEPREREGRKVEGLDIICEEVHDRRGGRGSFTHLLRICFPKRPDPSRCTTKGIIYDLGNNSLLFLSLSLSLYIYIYIKCKYWYYMATLQGRLNGPSDLQKVMPRSER